ncbi:hypothetical protein I4U23_019117 [Adineta vaga]|nr:hypothetical protein I4U23_019117 [Adineta vaga]
MANRTSSRSHHQPPPSSYERCRISQPIWIKNDIECEPESITISKRQSGVAGLVEQFEKRNVTDNIRSFRIKPKRTNIDAYFVHQLRSSDEIPVETSTHMGSQLILTKTFSTDSDTQTIENLDSLNDHFSNAVNSIIPSSQRPSLISQEDSANNDFCISSISIDDPSDITSSDEDEDNINKKKIIPSKRYDEIYDTEQTYIEKLRVLSPLKTILKKLYKFHIQVILPRIEECKLGDYENFNQRRLNEICKSGTFLDKAMLECQVYLGNLYPLAELNCANQRLLRYILLMESHMKRLDENSLEYKHTSSIRDGLRQIALRCEDELAVSGTQLKKLKRRFDNKLDYFKHQRLLWHGELKWRSPRRRIGVEPCYVLLFSECILVCEESGDKLELKQYLSLENITIDLLKSEQSISNSLDQKHSNVVIYPFRVKAIEKCYEFLIDKEQGRKKWIAKIMKASDDYARGSTNVEIRPLCHHSNRPDYGLRAPVWVNDNDVKRCQICQNRFGFTLISSRHHCRSCGRCICASCSTKKFVLKYCAEKGARRICDTCFSYFTGKKKDFISSTKNLRNPYRTILFGDFEYASTNSTVWIDLQEDHHLYIYGAKLDLVEDFMIDLTQLCEMSLNEKTYTLIMNTKDKVYKFTLKRNHQITYLESNRINQNMMCAMNKSLFYAKLWYDSIQLARLKVVPSWYIRKRDSADSGIIAV